MRESGTVTLDRELVGAVIDRLLDRCAMNRKEFAKEAGLSRPTLYRALAGDASVSQRVLRRVEATLSLPYDTLSYVALHDWQSLEEIGTDAELLRWVRRRAGSTDD